ncbi:Crp/Fnr family transcriptional regulator [Rhodobacteraceae bacterium]|nr:Crp/Fnr family transcriptional regulator [Paracoccaceae bacterium]
MAGQTLDDKAWANARLGWLGERSPDFAAAVRDLARLRSYSAGEYPHHIGDAPGGIYGIVEGSFGTYTQSEQTGIVLGHIFQQGDWFGQGGLSSNKPRYLTFKAMEPSVVLYLSPDGVDHIARTLAAGERELMSLSEYNQTLMARVVSDLLIRKTECRVASVLLRLFEITPDARILARACCFTQAELSEMTNTSRHTINTLLRSFEARGWIAISYKSITLKNADALRSCAQS